jgi:hypothetical protein
MTTIERAEELRQQAIAMLLQDRDAINFHLATLGYDGSNKPEKQKGATRKCGKCGSSDHNARRCKSVDEGDHTSVSK